ncbi:MAG: ABC transporter permease [Acidobacteria bacterium]|nr:ABC transporter permease [Acidobacteriota bacterium]
MGAWLAFVGRNTLAFLRYSGGVARLGGDAAYWTLVAPWRGKGLRVRATIHQMVLTGVNAVPIVSLIALFVGMILAFQSAYELRKYGGTVFVVNLVAVAMTRQLGPLMTAVIVAGRSASSFAAELGTMKVGEELDALETMGLNRVKFLVVPKYLALILMMPCLTLVADLMGIVGGSLFTTVELGMPLSYYWSRAVDALLLKDILSGLIKSVVFGIIITEVGCYEGFSVRGGAEGVGLATTSSVVTSITAIIAADMFFSGLFYYIW